MVPLPVLEVYLLSLRVKVELEDMEVLGNDEDVQDHPRGLKSKSPWSPILPLRSVRHITCFLSGNFGPSLSPPYQCPPSVPELPLSLVDRSSTALHSYFVVMTLRSLRSVRPTLFQGMICMLIVIL